MKYRSLALLSALVLSAGLAACSSSGGSSDGAGDGRTALDVWLMRDSVSAKFQKEFETGFEKARPDIDVKIQIQVYAVQTALAHQRYDLGSAASMLTVLLMSGVLVLYFRQLFRQEGEQP
ncbi:hypothetical protein STENM327S_03329 [Streptomyces tendae]